MSEADSGFELKGTSFTLSVLRLSTTDPARLRQGLEQKIAQAPRFFKHAPVVLDLSPLPQQEPPLPDLVALQNLLRELELIPVGVAGAGDAVNRAARAAGLAVMRPANSKQPHSSQTAHQPAKFINRPVRSGQQIYARERDLIIFGPVSPGAEVIADGDIHIFGPLRGRAIAGASGDEHARISCQLLDPELISIHGNYWLNDHIPTTFKGAQASICWDGSQLQVQSNA